MHCATCGSQVTTPTCRHCGAVAPDSRNVDTATGLVLTGWWRRVGATFADNVILFLPLYFALALFTSTSGALLGFLAVVALQGLYLVKLLSTAPGQTVGNRIAVTRVRDARTGQALSFRQATMRWAPVGAYQVVIALVAGRYSFVAFVVATAIDDLTPLCSGRKQTLHDMVAGTIVVMA